VYAVEVSDQIMIAHSFRGEVFGPAQKVHGATFVIRVAFLADELDAHGIVVDIARAHDVLKEALAPLNYRNLGRDGRALKSIRVTVAESPLARAWYEAPLW